MYYYRSVIFSITNTLLKINLILPNIKSLCKSETWDCYQLFYRRIWKICLIELYKIKVQHGLDADLSFPYVYYKFLVDTVAEHAKITCFHRIVLLVT